MQKVMAGEIVRRIYINTHLKNITEVAFSTLYLGMMHKGLLMLLLLNVIKRKMVGQKP